MTTEAMNVRIPIPKLNETISWDKKLEPQYADHNMKSDSLKYKARDEEKSRNYYLELLFDNISKKKNAELFENFLIETETSGGEAEPEPIIED